MTALPRAHIRTPYACVLFVGTLSMLTATPASSQTTAIYLDSEPGDFVGGGVERTIVPGQATFTATVPFGNTVEIRLTSQETANTWSLLFHAAAGAPLQVGTYYNAARSSGTTHVGMDVWGNGHGCNNVEGRFHVREIVYAGTTIQRLAIDFEQHCGSSAPALVGGIRYNSTISSLIPFDGIYPVYRFELAPTSHGRVTGPGVDCYGSGPVCALDFATPSPIALTATPDPGYVFAGWGGPCKGGLTSNTVLVHTVRQCSAVFVPAAGADVSVAMITSQKGSFVLNGQFGARQVYNPANSRWQVTPTITSSVLNSLFIVFDQFDDGTGNSWEFLIAAPTGMPLGPGSFANVPKDRTTTAYGFRSFAVGCASSTTDFVLHEIVVTAGVVTRLAFDFSIECLPLANPRRPVQGSIRFNSQVPLRPTLAVTTTTGVSSTIGGTVAFANGGACGVQCRLPAEPGTEVGLIATPGQGFVLARWAGDADCLDGSVTVSGPLACEAVFQRLLGADLVTPFDGLGFSQTFTLDYSSGAGGHDVATAWVWFRLTTFSPVNSCLMYYASATSRFFLLDDAGKTWMSTAAGSNSTLQNSRCSITAATSGATVTGTTLRVTVSVTFTSLAAGDRWISMYAANAAGDNSEWQERGFWTVPSSVVTAVTASPNAGGGTRQTFSLTYSDLLGGSNLTQAWIWFTQTSLGGSANSCLAYFDRPNGRLALLNDAGTAWAFAAIGSAQTLQNSQCALSPAASSASIDGPLLTVNLTVTFLMSYAGPKQILMYATNGGQTSNWVNRGTWTAQAALLTTGVPTPGSGTGATQVFSLPYSSNQGATALNTAWVWFNGGTLASPAAGSCLVYYEQPTNRLFLLNDTGTLWQSATLGAATTLQNGQCSIAVAGSTAAPSGDVLTWQLAMTFKPSFAGPKHIFMYTEGVGGASGWLDRGEWIVPSPVAPVTVDTVVPGAGSSASQAFALAYSIASGAADLTATWVWFNATLAQTAAASCLIYYEPATTLVYLLNDAGTAWQSAAIGSSATVLQNSQCAVNITDSQVGLNGNTLTVTLFMAFKPAFAGGKNVYLYANGSGGSSGWVDRGDWTVPASVTADGATPDSGTGSMQTFELQYSSVNGASALTTTWVWFNATLAPSAAGSCLAYYDQAANTLFLLNDAGTVWQSATLGVVGTLQNSQCSIDTGAASVAPAGSTLTVSLPVTFAAPFAGAKNIYLYAADAQSTSGWQDRGDWTP